MPTDVRAGLLQGVDEPEKRLRYFLQDDPLLQGVIVRILSRAIERCLRAHSPGSSATARPAAVVFTTSTIAAVKTPCRQATSDDPSAQAPTHRAPSPAFDLHARA